MQNISTHLTTFLIKNLIFLYPLKERSDILPLRTRMGIPSILNTLKALGHNSVSIATKMRGFTLFINPLRTDTRSNGRYTGYAMSDILSRASFCPVSVTVEMTMRNEGYLPLSSRMSGMAENTSPTETA